jgi:hypothetical protein
VSSVDRLFGYYDAARVAQGEADAALKLDQKAARDSKYAA